MGFVNDITVICNKLREEYNIKTTGKSTTYSPYTFDIEVICCMAYENYNIDVRFHSDGINIGKENITKDINEYYKIIDKIKPISRSIKINNLMKNIHNEKTHTSHNN